MKTALILISALALAACGEDAAAPAAKALNCEAREGAAPTAQGAWMREQADASAMSAAYFTLCNSSTAPIVLTGVSTPIAGVTEIHETTRDENGVVSMAPAGEIELAPGELVAFEPGGKHVMLMSLPAPIAPGERAALTLEFADGTSIEVEALAKSLAEAAAMKGAN
ncbi:MAG: copper chaperone PCu(A)C [Parvularculaceae bacterium]|nr:copper chaperone PCu(A)C [Parvularculaceae bacterium]